VEWKRRLRREIFKMRKLPTSNIEHPTSNERGASQLMAGDALFSLTPGCSRVETGPAEGNGLNRFRLLVGAMPLKRLCFGSGVPTGLKPGVNEKLQAMGLRFSERRSLAPFDVGCWMLVVECSPLHR
jgi:hypothetical protein